MDKDTDQATTPRRDCMREQIVGGLSPSPLASPPQNSKGWPTVLEKKQAKRTPPLPWHGLPCAETRSDQSPTSATHNRGPTVLKYINSYH